MAVVERGPTQIQEVLAKGPVPDPHPTLEAARNDPARRAKIDEVRKFINENGIKYIFFQQVSVSGHVNGKGVSATMWEKVAEAGYQLVYGATADLFVDQQDRYIGFGPEESELAAIADVDTFRQLPWDTRVARVFCDCYDTESGGLLESDPPGRQPLDLPADLRRGRAQARRRRDVHAEAVHGRLRERRAPPLHSRRRGGEQRLLRAGGPRETVGDRPPVHGRHPRALPRPLRDHGADGQLIQALLGLRLLGADLQGLRLAESDDARARRERR